MIVSRYVSLSDIYSLGGTCRLARQTVRQNGNLWKSLVCQRCPSNLWTKTNIDIDDWVVVAMTTQDQYDASSDRQLVQRRIDRQMREIRGERIDHTTRALEEFTAERAAEKRIEELAGGLYLELQRQHILWRLSLPMSSKEALRLYCEISTPSLGTDTGVATDLSYEKVILVGSLFPDDDEGAEDGKAKSYYELKKSQNALTKSRRGLTLTDSQERERLDQEGEDEKGKDEKGKDEKRKRRKCKPLKKTMRIQFKRADGKAFYFWRGEKGFTSTAKYYTVDRINSVSNDAQDKHNMAFTNCIGYMAKDQTILSKDDLETIGRLTKADRHQEAKSKPKVEGQQDDIRGDDMMRARMLRMFSGAGVAESLSVYAYTEWSSYLRFDQFFASITENSLK